MKRTLVLSGVLACLILTPQAALAAKGGNGNGGGNGAEVVKSEGCALPLPPDENGVVRDFADSDARLMFVETPSGNTHSHCHGQLPEGVEPPGRAIVLEGFPCATEPPAGGVTTRSKAVITPSGRVNTNCHSKG